MHSRRAFLAATVAGGALVGIGLAPRLAFASIEDDARAFLTNLGNRAIAELTDKSAPEAERVSRFRGLMREAIDFALISQQVLGKYWRQTAGDLREEFNRVLRETLIQRFLPLFDKYEGETFDVVSTRTSSKDPSVVAATVNVKAPNGNIAKVEWYMKQSDSTLKIYDFSAEGVRLTISLQDEYDAVLRSADGDVAVLIGEMKKKLPADAVLD